MEAKIILVDFDGVLHSYQSGWQGAEIVADPPVPGAIEWLEAMVDFGFDVRIYSSRSHQAGGIQAMQAWLISHGLPSAKLHSISFPSVKPAGAFLTIDDRAIQFNGIFPSVSEIDTYVPWHRRKPL